MIRLHAKHPLSYTTASIVTFWALNFFHLWSFLHIFLCIFFYTILMKIHYFIWIRNWLEKCIIKNSVNWNNPFHHSTIAICGSNLDKLWQNLVVTVLKANWKNTGINTFTEIHSATHLQKHIRIYNCIN